MIFLLQPISSSSSSFNRPHCYFEQKKPPLLHCHVTNSSSPPLQPHFMVDFLTTNCGFSSDKATTVTSKHLSHLKSTNRPNSFLTFMRSHGFNDAQIKKIVSSEPDLLCYDADKTLAPKLKSFSSLGFSASDIVHLINSTPTVLNRSHGSVLPKLQFWESLLGSRDNLMKLFKSNQGWFLLSDPETRVKPNISLLRDCGISHESIVHALMRNPAFVRLRTPEEMAAAIEHIETRLGIACHSRMFMTVLSRFIQNGKRKFDAKLKLMRSFGWSEEEFISALCKQPNFVLFAEEALMKKMSFLVKEAGCAPSEVAQNPTLVTYSLQNRLIPRHRVIRFLRSRGLIQRECKLASIMNMSSKAFMGKYVFPHKDNHPELQQMYVAGCESDANL